VLILLSAAFLSLPFIGLAYHLLRSSASFWLLIVPVAFLANGALIVFFLVKWQISTFGYECPSCKHRFEIDMSTALLTPHVWSKKRLRCPGCGKTGWAQEVVKVK